MSRASSVTADDLREEIDLNEAVLNSLEHDQTEDGVATKERLTKKLNALKEKRETMMQPSQSLPYWGYSDNDAMPAYTNQQSHQQHVSGSSSSPYSSQSAFLPLDDPNTATLNTMSLPSRKRSRPEPDFEFPSTRLHRPTPSPALFSHSGGFGTSNNEFPVFADNSTEEPEMVDLFGDDWQTESHMNRQCLRDLERRKLQEEEDHEFAKQLQETWNQAGYEMKPTPSLVSSRANYSQSYMMPNGSYQKPQPQPQPQPSLSRIKSEVNPGLGQGSATSVVSTPVSDSSSGLEEISATDWNQSYGSGRNLTHNFAPKIENHSYNTMPGSFPSALSNPFLGISSSVYGNNSYSASTSSVDWDGAQGNHEYLNTALSMLGSAAMPLDLDSYPSSTNSPNYPPFSDPAQTRTELKELLKHIRPDEQLTEEQLREVQPEGLKIDLMAHQRKGFAWMKSMEDGTNKGGILGDDMGLGKTVQALSLILARKPEAGIKRPTLVVAPVALMLQWEREIKKFVKPSHTLNVLLLHQDNRNKSWKDINRYDVVLTTYGTLASELKRRAVWKKHVAMVPDAIPKPQEQLPLLGERSHFHRIILDEAQNIKNRHTKSAVAACSLRADYRWCLTGTPMQNNVDEIYSLIRFCKIRPYHEWETFNRDIGRPLKATREYGKEKAMKQLQAILKAVCLRRTKKSEIDGKPILQLPEKRTVEDRAVFSSDERSFYKQLEAQAQIQFNRFLKDGTVGRHYSHALVLLLRLRQCCCSPQLVTNAKDFMTTATIGEGDRIENAKSLPPDAIRRLDDNDAFECPICIDAVENPIIFNPCGHSLCNECLAAMTDKVMNDANPSLLCPHCRAVIDPHKMTDLESYLRVHHPEREGIEPLDADEDDDDDDTDADSDSSDSDQEDDRADDDDGQDLKDFIVPDDDELNYDTDADEDVKKESILDRAERDTRQEKTESEISRKKKSKSKRKDNGKGKGKAKEKIVSLAQLRREGLKNQKAKKRYLRRLERGYQPSAKIEKAIQLLQEVRDRGEGEKTIVFSSFTSFLDLLEVPLSKDEDLSGYVRYDGSMKTQDRNQAVLRFSDDPRCKVILVSLKAGNAGLNLTAANHVIMLDPFWNPFVEYQAADRCYRIGQQRDVTIHRVLIGDDQGGELDESDADFTVEDRILRLQEKKRILVETALDEKAASSLGRLTTRDLGYLFGVNAMD